VELETYAKSGGDVVEYLALKTLSKDTNKDISDLALESNNYSARELSSLILGDAAASQRAPTSFTDPNRSGYEYRLTDTQKARYTETFDHMFAEEFTKLFNSRKYQNADAEERANLVDELKSDVAKDVKKEIAKWLKQQGVKSSKK